MPNALIRTQGFNNDGASIGRVLNSYLINTAKKKAIFNKTESIENIIHRGMIWILINLLLNGFIKWLCF